MNFAVLFGDRRFRLLAAELQRRGHTVVDFAEGSEDRLQCAVLSDIDVCLLPIPVTRQDDRITGSRYPVADVPARFSERVWFFGGNPPPIFPKSRSFNYLTNEKFTLRNAALTAEGCLRLLLENTEKSLSETSVQIWGYGRIGRYLVSLLLPICRSVTVVARRKEARVEARKEGAVAVPFQASLPFADVCLNTVPPPFRPTVITAPLFLDLAGVITADLPESTRVIPAPGLPGRFFPFSAANILCDTILETL